MRRLLGISLIALTTLMLELGLARLFDAIILPSVAYMVITCAVFGYGLAGLYVAVRPLAWPAAANLLSPLAALTAASMLLLLPVTNSLPFDFSLVAANPLRELAAFGALYLALIIPFFMSGLILTMIFSRYARDIRRLYCCDLVGAAVGCVAVIPLMPAVGPGGLLFLAAAFTVGASALFSRGWRWTAGASVVAVGLAVVPFVAPPSSLEFRQHTERRGVKAAQAAGRIEFTRWDPVAKIDVIPQARGGPPPPLGGRWHVAFDGGLMSTFFYPFDGDFATLRARIDEGVPGTTQGNFWTRGALASHHLKRDTGARVLVIGSAGGQETKAALMYGASHVDAVELVRTVVELGRGRYAKAIGNIFEDPRVSVHVAEGRSFLRASHRRYDIIQFFSTFASRTLAEGSGALQPVYLQTVDAYREYFNHLTPNGILHINYAVYPRMITTAALAWRQLGRTDFHRHVLVYEPKHSLPTMLISMQPWRPEDVNELTRFLNRDGPPATLVVNPVGPDHNFLSEEFFSGEFPSGLDARLAYHAAPTTDDRPFFLQLRKRIEPLEVDSLGFVNASIANLLNGSLKRGWMPMDVAHLFVTGVVSLLFMLVTVAIPLRYAPIGRQAWVGKFPMLGYFACLGAGFIILELGLIQLLMKLVGYPLYAYAVVICVLLLAAGLGSFASQALGVSPEHRWGLPFAGVLACGLLLLLIQQPVSQLALAAPLPIRTFVAAALVFPLGFFLGMPFPLGILVTGRLPEGAVAWAWALNGVFTVAGGVLTSLLAMSVGFRATILVGLTIYAVALALFAAVRQPVTAAEPAAGDAIPGAPAWDAS